MSLLDFLLQIANGSIKRQSDREDLLNGFPVKHAIERDVAHRESVCDSCPRYERADIRNSHVRCRKPDIHGTQCFGLFTT